LTSVLQPSSLRLKESHHRTAPRAVALAGRA